MLAIAYACVKKAKLCSFRQCSEQATESCPDLQDWRWDKACSCEGHCVGLLVGHCSCLAKPDGSPVSPAVQDLHLLKYAVGVDLQ